MKYYPLIFFLCGLLFCTCESNQSSEVSESVGVDTLIEQPTSSAAAPTEKLPIPANQIAKRAFGEPRALELSRFELLCQNKYGCLQERIFPMGWSGNGYFAYLIERTNEAVNNYTLDFYIQSTATNKLVDSLRFRASEQAGYKESDRQYTFKKVWKLQAEVIKERIDKYQLIPFSGTTLYQAPDIGFQLKVKDERQLSLYTGKEVLSSHLLEVQTDTGTKSLKNRIYGKYDLILNTEVIGIFQNPGGNHHALLEAEEQRGFEGPPNILKLRVIGF